MSDQRALGGASGRLLGPSNENPCAGLSAAAAVASAFKGPEIKAIPRTRVDRMVREEPKLAACSLA